MQDASKKTRPIVQEVLMKTGYLLVQEASKAWYPSVVDAPQKNRPLKTVSEVAGSATEDRGSAGAERTGDRVPEGTGSNNTGRGSAGSTCRGSAGITDTGADSIT